MLLLLSTDVFITFSKKIFQEHYQCVNSLDPDQNQHFVGPDLGPNCLQRLSADNKVLANKERVKLSNNQ